MIWWYDRKTTTVYGSIVHSVWAIPKHCWEPIPTRKSMMHSYWNYDALLALQDTPYTVALTAQPGNGDGSTGLCQMLAQEYEALKTLGVEYHNATYFESVSPTFNTPSILSSPFYVM